MESFVCFAARTTPFQTDSVPNEPTFGLPTSLAHKVSPGTGALLPFHGNTIAYFLEEATRDLTARLTHRLHEQHEESLAESLPSDMAHLTLHDLHASSDANHVRPLVAASTQKAMALVASARDVGSVRMMCTAVFNLMNTSVALGVRAADEDEHRKLMAARAIFDEIIPGGVFTPHITLAYYRPEPPAPMSPPALRASLLELTQDCAGVDFTLDPSRLHVLHFDSMARYTEPTK